MSAPQQHIVKAKPKPTVASLQADLTALMERFDNLAGHVDALEQEKRQLTWLLHESSGVIKALIRQMVMAQAGPQIMKELESQIQAKLNSGLGAMNLGQSGSGMPTSSAP